MGTVLALSSNKVIDFVINTVTGSLGSAFGLFTKNIFDSIFTTMLYQMAVWLQALVRVFCSQFFTAFTSFNSSIDDLLEMFGCESGAVTLAGLNWFHFSSDGTVLNIFAAFAAIGLFVAVLLFVIGLFKAALAPVIEAKEKPTTLVVRFVIAMILILYSPSIVNLVSDSTQALGEYVTTMANGYNTDGEGSVYERVVKYDTIVQLFNDGADSNGIETSEGAPDMDTFQQVAAAIVEIVCSITLCVEFLKLLAEMCMRLMVLFMEYLLFPAMAGTIVSRDTERIFHSYLQALFVQCILVSTSMVWYVLFIGISGRISFAEWGIVAGMLLEIGYLQMARNVDNYLSKFGVSSVGVSSNLFDSIMGSFNTVANTARAVGRDASAIKKGSIGQKVAAKHDKALGLERDSRGNIDVSRMKAEDIAKMNSPVGKTSAELKSQQDALKNTMQSPKVFNALDKNQRAAAVSASFGGKDNLMKVLDAAGVDTANSKGMDFKLNSDGSISVSGAKFRSGNAGNFAITPNGMVTPGAAASFSYSNDGKGTTAQVGAEGKLRPGDNPIKTMPETDAEAFALTGHSQKELKASPALAAGYAGDTSDFVNTMLDEKAEGKHSVRDSMTAGGIDMKNDMHMGRDGLIHGQAEMDGLGEKNVVLGSKDELAKAGYKDIATFDAVLGEDANGKPITKEMAMALEKPIGDGQLSAKGINSDAVAVAGMMGIEDAKAFNDDAVNHLDMFATDKDRAAALQTSLNGGTGGFEKFAGGMTVQEDFKGGIHAKAGNGGVMYDLTPTGQTYGSPEERKAAIESGNCQFVDAAGNGYSAKVAGGGIAHGGVGDYSVAPEESSGAQVTAGSAQSVDTADTAATTTAGQDTQDTPGTPDVSGVVANSSTVDNPFEAGANDTADVDAGTTLTNDSVARDRTGGDTSYAEGAADIQADDVDSSSSDSGTTVHSGAGSASTDEYDLNSRAARDRFEWNTGSTIEDVQKGFAGTAQDGDEAYVNDIAGISIQENGAQTAYNSNGECIGARVVDKANSSRGNTHYMYDAAASSGCTNEETAAVMFGEQVTTEDNGATWKTAGGTQYMRMYAASSTGYDPSRATASAKTGNDEAGRPYVYVKMEKNKGFDKGKVNNGARNRRRNGNRVNRQRTGENQ